LLLWLSVLIYFLNRPKDSVRGPPSSPAGALDRFDPMGLVLSSKA
jgi:hypothetical protein